jgi:hypothetical protein
MSVVSINKSNFNNQEFITFVNALNFQNWTFKVQNIIQSTGLPLASDFTIEETILPSGSMASSFGHKTLGDYIKSSEDNMGHNYSWTEWKNELKAFEYKSNFAISENDKMEILSQVKDVETLLGRLPNNGMEFHQVKDKILLGQKRETEVRHQSEIRVLEVQVESLKNTLNESKKDFDLLNIKLNESMPSAVLQSYIDQIQDKEKIIIDLKTQVSLLEGNSVVQTNLEIHKLIENYNTVLNYLNRFKERNSILNNEVSLLKT